MAHTVSRFRDPENDDSCGDRCSLLTVLVASGWDCLCVQLIWTDPIREDWAATTGKKEVASSFVSWHGRNEIDY